MGLPYRGKRERPPSRAERRQLAVMAAATVVGLVATVTGLLVFLPAGHDRLGPVVWQGGILVMLAAGFLSTRHLVSARRRRFQAGLVAGLSLLWLATVVGYLSDR